MSEAIGSDIAVVPNPNYQFFRSSSVISRPNNAEYEQYKKAIQDDLLGGIMREEGDLNSIKDPKKREEARLRREYMARPDQIGTTSFELWKKDGKTFTDHSDHRRSATNAASGLVPNFTREALRDAVEREKAAGYTSGQVRVGTDSRLKRSGGLGVYNTTEGSLTNAINMHLAGGNTIGGVQSQGAPATASGGAVPNFAGMEGAMLMAEMSMMAFTLKDLGGSFKELKGGFDGTPEQLAKLDKAIETATAAQEEQANASKAAMEAEKAANEALVKSKADLAEGEAKRDELKGKVSDIGEKKGRTQDISDSLKRKAALSDKKRAELEGQRDKIQDKDFSTEAREGLALEGGYMSGMEMMGAAHAGDEKAKDLLARQDQKQSELKQAEIAEMEKQIATQKEKTENLKEQSGKARELSETFEKQEAQAEKNLKEQKDKNSKLGEQRDKAKKGAESAKKAAGEEAELLGMFEDETKKAKKKKGAKKKTIGGRLGGFMDKGGATSMMAGAPMLAGIAAQGLSEDDLQGKAKVEGIGNAAAMAATGAQMGQMLGPYGAAVGALVGLGVGVAGAANAMAKAKIEEKMKDIAKESELLGKKLSGVESGGQAYMTALDKMNQIMSDTSGHTDPEDVRKVRQSMTKAMGDIPTEFQARFAAAAGDAAKIKEIFGEITQELRNAKADLDSAGKGYEVQAQMAFGEYKMDNLWGLGNLAKGKGFTGDHEIFETGAGGALTAEAKKAKNTFQGIFQTEGAINKKEMAERLERGEDLPSIGPEGLSRNNLFKFKDLLGGETFKMLDDIGSPEDLKYAGILLKEFFDTAKDGAEVSKEIIKQTEERNKRDRAYNKTIKGFQNDISNLNSIMSSVVKTVKARIYATQELDAKVKEFQINLAQADFSGARGLAKPFQTAQQEIELDLEGKQFEIRETSINSMRKAVTGTGQKNLDLILEKFTQVSDKASKHITDLAGKDNKATLGELQRNQKAQKAMLPVIEDALVTFADRPDDEGAMLDVTQRMKVILEKNGVMGTKASPTAAF